MKKSQAAMTYDAARSADQRATEWEGKESWQRTGTYGEPGPAMIDKNPFDPKGGGQEANPDRRSMYEKDRDNADAYANTGKSGYSPEGEAWAAKSGKLAKRREMDRYR